MDLRSRISELERKSGLQEAAPRPLAAEPAESKVRPGVEAALAPADNPGPLFGWAFLGLSGAYLLRALTESGAIPGLAGAIAGMLYAAWWLILAAQRGWEKPLASSVHGVTASLIIAPMLWETTVRFRLMTVDVASAVLIAFAVLGLAIAWRHNITAIAWVTTFAALLTAFGIFRETHDGRAWVVTVLVITAAVEFSACRDHWLSLRWLAAATADLTVLTLTVIAARPYAGAATVISPAFMLGAQVGLLTIYLASTVDRTLIRKLPFTWFEIGQAAVSFLIAVGGALHLADVTTIGRSPVGPICLAGAAACYLISFAMLDRNTRHNRNFYTYSTFGGLLVLAGSRLMIAGNARVIVWTALAVGMMTLGMMTGRMTLRVHAAVCLTIAAATAEAMERAGAWLIQTPGRPPEPVDVMSTAVLLSSVACYGAIVLFGRREIPHWTDTVEALLSAAVLCWTGAGLLAAWSSSSVSWAAPLRTALLTTLSVALAWCGTRWRRRELVWLAYPVLCAAGAKLVVEDFGQGQSLNVFVSLTFCGATLILLPRILSAGRPQSQATAAHAVARRAGA
jgi:hypothetical protein